MNQQTIEGHWHQLKGFIRSQWGQITDNELDEFEGNLEQLVGMIEDKTGEGREEIEEQLADFFQEANRAEEEAGSMTQQAADRANQAVEQAAETVQQAGQQAVEVIRDRYHEAEQTIQRKPLESLALSFAAGMVVGVGAMLFLRSR